MKNNYMSLVEIQNNIVRNVMDHLNFQDGSLLILILDNFKIDYSSVSDINDLGSFMDLIEVYCNEDYLNAVNILKFIEQKNKKSKTKNIYRFGFYKYWKASWIEDYYISETDENFITKIQDTLIKNIYVGPDSPIDDSKIKYINEIKSCKCIDDFKKVSHWHQNNIKMSFKFIELI